MLIKGARGSVVSWGTMLRAGISRVRFPMRSFGSTQEMSMRNLPGGNGRPTRKADNFTAICEPIVQKMWEPRRLITLWASTACYRDDFTFTL
jgi:hypothetical protein